MDYSVWVGGGGRGGYFIGAWGESFNFLQHKSCNEERRKKGTNLANAGPWCVAAQPVQSAERNNEQGGSHTPLATQRLAACIYRQCAVWNQRELLQSLLLLPGARRQSPSKGPLKKKKKKGGVGRLFLRGIAFFWPIL
jgi:hypothetical protein